MTEAEVIKAQFEKVCELYDQVLELRRFIAECRTYMGSRDPERLAEMLAHIAAQHPPTEGK